jgi:UDP-GalNAc:undecaprenyl-phosphate GalNAc-1-phosphate transferase
MFSYFFYLNKNRFYSIRLWSVLAISTLTLFVILTFASWLAFGSPALWKTSQIPAAGGLMALCAIAFLGSAWIAWRWGRFPHSEIISSTVLSSTLGFLTVTAILIISRWWYSRPFLLTAFLLTVCFNLILQQWRLSLPLRVQLLPDTLSQQLLGQSRVQATVLPLIPPLEFSVDPVVADLHTNHSPEWTRFLSNCALHGTPVLDASSLLEALTGRVSIEALSSDALPYVASRAYLGLKRILETILILGTSPLWLVIVGVAALGVRFDSPGSILFFQERVGLGGRVFRMVKFRSMRIDSEANGARFAASADERITSFGRLIRKFRIDELPQIWNILRGEMAFIGPRPEQVKFVEEFSNKIPFYNSRHLVRPGLTGWAQVVHGYASNEDETREKLEFDLYYVKHFSFWLDMLVILKTIRVVLSGFGSR